MERMEPGGIAASDLLRLCTTSASLICLGLLTAFRIRLKPLSHLPPHLGPGQFHPQFTVPDPKDLVDRRATRGPRSIMSYLLPSAHGKGKVRKVTGLAAAGLLLLLAGSRLGWSRRRADLRGRHPGLRAEAGQVGDE